MDFRQSEDRLSTPPTTPHLDTSASAFDMPVAHQSFPPPTSLEAASSSTTDSSSEEDDRAVSGLKTFDSKLSGQREDDFEEAEQDEPLPQQSQPVQQQQLQQDVVPPLEFNGWSRKGGGRPGQLGAAPLSQSRSSKINFDEHVEVVVTPARDDDDANRGAIIVTASLKKRRRRCFGKNDSDDDDDESDEEKKINDDDDDDSDEPRRPNGGFGWVVMIASFFSHVFGGGILYSFGIFLPEWTKYFGASRAEVAWIGSSMPVMCLIGPLASMLTNRFGARAVGLGGAIFGALGPLLSLWNPSVISLYFTFGVWIGLGLGIGYIPCIVILSEYFDSNLPLATGIAVSGAGMGTFIFAPIWQFLIEEYSWKGSLLFMSGVILNQAVCSMLYRPVNNGVPRRKNNKNRNNDEDQDGNEDEGHRSSQRTALMETISKLDSTSGDAEGLKALNVKILVHQKRARHNSDNAHRLPEGIHSKMERRMIPIQTCPVDVKLPPSSLLSSDRGATPRGSRSQLSLGLLNVPPYSISQLDLHRRSQSSLNLAKVSSRKSMMSHASFADSKQAIDIEPPALLPPPSRDRQSRCAHIFDVSLFTDAKFVLFAFSMLFVSLGYNIPFVFIVDRAVDLGVSKSDAAFLLSIAGITNTIGRIVFGIISNNDRVSRLHVYAFACIVCGIFTVAYPLCNTYATMICYVAAFSISIAGYLCLTSVILCDLLGVERLANSLGVCLLVQGVGLLVGPPFAGFLYDTSLSYDSSFIIAGLLLAASGAVLLPIPLLQKCRDCRSSEELGATEPVI